MNAAARVVPPLLGALVAATVFAVSPADGAAVPEIDGATLFAAKGCSTCHAGPDSDPTIGGFPSLVDAGVWAGERRPGLDAAAYLTESMQEPSVFLAPGYRSNGLVASMPSLALETTEVEALVEYLLG